MPAWPVRAISAVYENLISVSSVKPLSPRLPRHVLGKFLFIGKLLRNL
jgi:hypothetical protein